MNRKSSHLHVTNVIFDQMGNSSFFNVETGAELGSDPSLIESSQTVKNL